MMRDPDEDILIAIDAKEKSDRNAQRLRIGAIAIAAGLLSYLILRFSMGDGQIAMDTGLAVALGSFLALARYKALL